MKKAIFVATEILMLGIFLFPVLQEREEAEAQKKQWKKLEAETDWEEADRIVTQKECILCSETASVFGDGREEEERTEKQSEEYGPLFLCNVNTGACIDLLVGNPNNSMNDRKKGRRELHFPREKETTVKILSLREKDLCEVTMYLNESSDTFQEAKDRLCKSCLDQIKKGETEFVLCSQKEKTVHPFVSGAKLFFAGDYGVHLDWKEDGEQIDIIIFYSPNISCMDREFVL